jgi:hypothetical protein
MEGEKLRGYEGERKTFDYLKLMGFMIFISFLTPRRGPLPFIINHL